MSAEVLFNVGHGLADNRVWRKFRRRGDVLRAFFIKSAAVFGVVIPAPTQWLLALHHHLMTFAHHAVEIFHAHLLVALGPVGKFMARDQKMLVFTPGQLDLLLRGEFIERLLDAPIPGLDHHYFSRPQAVYSVAQCCTKAGESMFAYACVFKGDAALTQQFGKMTHCSKEIGGARFSAPNVGRLLGHLSHEHAVRMGIEIDQSGAVFVKLIAENKHKVSHNRQGGGLFLSCHEWNVWNK